MKFKSVLIEKQLEKEKLPLKLRNKIKQLEKIEEDISSAEQEAKTPEDYEGIAIAQLRLSSLDEELVDMIENFDPLKYQMQKDKMAKINKVKKVGRPKKKTEPKVEPEVQPTEPSKPTEEESILEQIPPISKTLHIKEDLDKLQEEVEIDTESFHEDRAPLEDVIEPEIVDFEKHEGAKPKKMSKGLILMGVGAFLLTWGAVNFFRERRG